MDSRGDRMIRKEPAFRLKPYRIIIVILLLVNTALVVWALYLLRDVSQQRHRFGYKQEVAQDLAAYNQRLATDLNVLDRKEVKEALATFNYDIAMASTSDELTQVILNHGRRVQEIILREAENKLLDQLLAVVNQDANVRAIVDRTYLKVNVTDQESHHRPQWDSAARHDQPDGAAIAARPGLIAAAHRY